ncbi:HamA C-terminal domain-containing protein [Pirellulaceae bacterium SH501]
MGHVANKSLLSLLNDWEDGRWRLTQFNDYIWDNMAETALSYREREALAGNPRQLLRAAAQKLRLIESDKDTGAGGELAEALLYGIMKDQYHALPVVPKIFYKQNTNDYAKGSDSVHIVIIPPDDFSIWFGEAKFFNSIEDVRLDKVTESVLNSLNTEKLKKENSIVTSLSDLDQMVSPALAIRIRAALEPKNSIDTIKDKIHIPILLLHECAVTRGATALDASYLSEIDRIHKDRAEAYFRKQLQKLASVFKYNCINFHLILFPVPDKSELIDLFKRETKGLRG